MFRQDLLDILLAVQQETEKRAKKQFDALAGYRVHHIALELLWAKIWQAFGKCLGEPGTEHNNELERFNNVSLGGLRVGGVNLGGMLRCATVTIRTRELSCHDATATRLRAKTRTAMSGLSARMY